MIGTQKIVNVNQQDLIPKVKELYDSGYRLVQIGCTKLDVFEINYSFDKDFDFINLKLILPLTAAEVKSISGVYWGAFIYENEIHDLFGITVKNMAIDYRGNFYHTKIKSPFCIQPEDVDEEKPGGEDG